MEETKKVKDSKKVKIKKERSTNFSNSETELLVRCAIRYKSVIQSKQINSAAIQKKKKAWKLVTEKYNKRCEGAVIIWIYFVFGFNFLKCFSLILSYFVTVAEGTGSQGQIQKHKKKLRDNPPQDTFGLSKAMIELYECVNGSSTQSGGVVSPLQTSSSVHALNI